MQHREEIDGLRALAVVPVMLFHAGFDRFAGGFVGVDVFFVISGYLITSIIMGEQAKGKFSLLTFYERRARRILPALFLVMLCCLPFAHLWMMPEQKLAFARSLVAVTGFVSNFLFWRESGYFGAAAEEKPLLHTWSLAVEEQYYLVFPLIIMLLWPLGRRWIVGLLIAAALVSLTIAEWASTYHPEANFFLAPSRFWELLAGGFCALYLQNRPAPLGDGARHDANIRQALAMIGLGMIFYAILVFDSATPFPSLWALLPVGGTALVVLFATHETWAGKLLSWRGFVGVGLISYSAYLWHQPLFAFARLRSVVAPTEVIYLGLGLLALALAYISWRYIEKPFRDKSKTSRKQIFAFSIGGMVVFAATGSYGAYQLGFEENFIQNLNRDQAYAYSLMQVANAEKPGALVDDGACQFGTSQMTPAFTQRIANCYAQHGPALVVIGDSHGRDVYQALVENVQGGFIIGLISGGCRPQNKGPRCTYYGDFRQWLAANPQMVGHIIYHSAGLRMLSSANGRPAMRTNFRHRSERLHPDPKRIQAIVSYTVQLAQFAPVTWLGPRMEPHVSALEILQTATLNSDAAQQGTAAIIPQIKPEVAQSFAALDAYGANAIAHANSSVTYISYMQTIPFDAATSFSSCCALYWADTDHWSEAGEKHFGAQLVRALK